MSDRRPESRKQRIHQAIAERIGIAILTGQHKPGEALGGEIEAAEALRVSRTPYREAIRTLVAKGLLESRPKAGTHVTPRHQWNMLDPDILAWMFSGEPDEQFTRDLFELRGFVEPAAAGLAAERRTPQQVEQMGDALDAMRRFGLATREGREADQAFHRTLLEAAGNELLTSLSGSISAAVTWTTRFKQRRGQTRDPHNDHVAVFEAVAAADPVRAQKAMQDLLRLALIDMKA